MTISNPTGTQVMPTRARQRLDTHRRIFEAAAAEISRHGVGGTSVASIANACGVSRQTVYDHFPTLDDVVAEAFARYRARVGAHLAEFSPDADLTELLDGLVTSIFAAMEPENVRMRQEIAAHLVKELEFAAWLEEPLFRIVSDATAAAQRNGLVRRDLEADDVARLILTSLSGFLLIESEAPAVRAARARVAVAIVVGGLRS